MKKYCFTLLFFFISATVMADLPPAKKLPFTVLPNGTIGTIGDAPIATPASIPLPSGGTLTVAQMSGGSITNEGAAGATQVNIPDVDQELSFTVEATTAQLISIGFAESGANPYLQGQQIGADNEIDVPAGAKLRIQRMQRGGAWVWWCTVIWGVPVDGGSDDSIF
jgi:hypothetical protein